MKAFIHEKIALLNSRGQKFLCSGPFQTSSYVSLHLPIHLCLSSYPLLNHKLINTSKSFPEFFLWGVLGTLIYSCSLRSTGQPGTCVWYLTTTEASLLEGERPWGREFRNPFNGKPTPSHEAVNCQMCKWTQQLPNADTWVRPDEPNGSIYRVRS